jgi:predicted small secreted protein
MKKLVGILVLAGTTALSGCNAFDIFGEDGNEVRVTITALAASSLTADDGHVYVADSGTEYEGAGLRSFVDLAVGQTVEIEWEAISGSSDRRALEIEAGDHDDNGDDD